MIETPLFTAAGHLTDAAFERMQTQQLSELQRLEVAEHLSFCDMCMQRYTRFLTEDKLLAPLEPVAPVVNRTMRKHQFNDTTYRYLTVAAAACLALTFWGIGVFDLDQEPNSNPRPTNVLQHVVSGTGELLEYGTQAAQKLGDGMQELKDDKPLNKSDDKSIGKPDNKWDDVKGWIDKNE